MKTSVYFLALGFFFLFACKPPSTPSETITKVEASSEENDKRLAKDFLKDCKKLSRDARFIDSTLMQQTEIDTVLANKAIRAFADFAYYCQSDSLSPMFLIKTAQVARVVNNIPQAKLALEHCIDTYLQFKNRPAAIFLLAQLYDESSYLNDENEAKRLYTQIINEYPNSDWALNAEAALRFIGKSDADIIKEFNKKQKSKKNKAS